MEQLIEILSPHFLLKTPFMPVYWLGWYARKWACFSCCGAWCCWASPCLRFPTRALPSPSCCTPSGGIFCRTWNRKRPWRWPVPSSLPLSPSLPCRYLKGREGVHGKPHRIHLRPGRGGVHLVCVLESIRAVGGAFLVERGDTFRSGRLFVVYGCYLWRNLYCLNRISS